MNDDENVREPINDLRNNTLINNDSYINNLSLSQLNNEDTKILNTIKGILLAIYIIEYIDMYDIYVENKQYNILIKNELYDIKQNILHKTKFIFENIKNMDIYKQLFIPLSEIPSTLFYYLIENKIIGKNYNLIYEGFIDTNESIKIDSNIDTYNDILHDFLYKKLQEYFNLIINTMQINKIGKIYNNKYNNNYYILIISNNISGIDSIYIIDLYSLKDCFSINPSKCKIDIFKNINDITQEMIHKLISLKIIKFI
jgi:hypothetical protein